jgi:hypothetical protein
LLARPLPDPLGRPLFLPVPRWGAGGASRAGSGSAPGSPGYTGSPSTEPNLSGSGWKEGSLRLRPRELGAP